MSTIHDYTNLLELSNILHEGAIMPLFPCEEHPNGNQITTLFLRGLSEKLISRATGPEYPSPADCDATNVN
jgi:hypothetical protein